MRNKLTPEIIENNKLIACFMGAEESHFGDYMVFKINNPAYTGKIDHQDIKYNYSWDWLMPVVINIFKLDLKEKGKQLFVTEADHYIYPLHNSLTIGIEQAFEAVVRFIKWYNSLIPLEED